MTVDVIDLTGRTLGWEKVLIDVDRTARPLTIVGGTFSGWGEASEGVFILGSVSKSRYITMTGQTYDGVILASAGVLGIWSTDHVTVTDQTFRDLRRDSSWAPLPIHSWAAYIADGSEVRNNTNLVIDRWHLERPAVRRDLSAIQIDSSNLQNGAIAISHIDLTGYAYAFYENVATNPLTLDGWGIDDSAWGTTAVAFHKATGWYRDLTLTGSGGIVVNSSGMVMQ